MPEDAAFAKAQPWRQLRTLAAGALDFVMPPLCIACGCQVDAPGALCAPCWTTLTFIEPPLCATCGVPFAFDVGEGARCGACLRRPPPFARARAAVAYGDGSRGLVLGLKHGDRTDGVRTFARWMTRAGEDLLNEADLIVPVPLHWTRLFRRRYNQAALLALAVGRLAGKPVIPDLLVRRRRTQKLGHLGPRERRRMVAGAFGLHRRAAERIRGRRVLLIDDVLTTAATVNGCALSLLAGGAPAVDVLTLARVVRPAS